MSVEFTIINDIFRRRVRPDGGVLLGIGDDAALTRVPAGCDLVTATDAMVEGTHFIRSAPARSVGHRCLAVNLSDLAAMAARPLWASMALGLPAFDRAWLEAFAEGFFALADRHDVRLIGGDTVRSASLFASVTVQGVLPAGTGIKRTGARAGDLIYVTGHPGDAAAGRRLSSRQEPGPAGPSEIETPLIHQFCFPEPRLAVGTALRSIASAMIDLSDGLNTDLARLLAASGAGAAVDILQLPLSAEIRAAFPLSVAQELALCGGEDYELCFTVPPDKRRLLESVIAGSDCTLTQIGEVCVEPGLCWVKAGAPYTVPNSGFEHFE